MIDNLVVATNSMRSSVSGLKKKLSNLRIQVESFDAEIEKITLKFDNVVTQSEIYKSKIEREMGREVRRLERELMILRKQVSKEGPINQPSNEETNIAATIGILDSLLRHISRDADDFRLASEAFLFPAVFERVMDSTDYHILTVPPSIDLVIERGREYVNWVRVEYYTHLTNPDTWEDAIPYIAEWWRNDALPLLYGARDEQWEIDVPLSLQEMMVWRDNPADRPLQFPTIFDAFEIYEKNKDAILESSGLKEFEVKRFLQDK
jgi:archaellum component FlaC